MLQDCLKQIKGNPTDDDNMDETGELSFSFVQVHHKFQIFLTVSLIFGSGYVKYNLILIHNLKHKRGRPRKHGSKPLWKTLIRWDNHGLKLGPRQKPGQVEELCNNPTHLRRGVMGL